MERDRPARFQASTDAILIDARRHAAAVGEWAGHIGHRLGIDGHRHARLVLAGQLHDVGKTEVPREILAKPGPLDEEEWRIIRGHPEAGARILAHPFFDDIRPFVLHHHERYDGGGYPYGLWGRSIPLEARIIAVADAWCAMTCDRPYRLALGDERALDEIRRGADGQFDPLCAEAMVELVLSRPTPGQRAGQRPRLAAVPAPPGA
jgi:HD-GYP domain-containing protein (c-di-GMP phosphodiesterase class II)